ncbi:MAG: ECF transporter S component [Oscillospiraceae bacterium]
MNTKKFIRISMLTALAVVLTMVPKIPTPTGGYVHFGDSIIYLASIFLGPWAGAAVGAVGHSLADIIGGYPIFALPTFFIKGLMGYTLGKIAYNKIDAKHLSLAAIAALLIVTIGYFVVEIPMYGLPGALISLVSSPVQWLMSIVASSILIPIVQRIRHKIDL